MAGEMSLEVLFEDLQKVNRALRTGSLRQGDLQITRVQWMILRTLRKRPGCPIGQLAEKLDVRPSTMSQMLDRLEKMGWIVRRIGSADSRVRTVDLTPEGERVIRTVESTWLSRLRRPFEMLSEEERVQLVTLFHKLAQAIPADRGVDDPHERDDPEAQGDPHAHDDPAPDR
ncbi:MarR family winged helix-turn-helix transcriptional regulator [Alicyclobacillus macrosporangiidus]|uniref:MarR family winged helix-turn-helix transcriptional regulator n=1 Tax=Alicyclobacillus macrosporangiidus TaxID=392015 RepID=UPI0009DDAF3D|nr:MarR family transcriptional regulator [Alicyclobacillus macrosporangiidus]